MTDASPILVGVRVRPFNQREIKHNSQNIIDMNANTVYLSQPSGTGVSKPRDFSYDYAFWTFDESHPYADQQAVFEKMGVHAVSNVLKGFNACLFAYGQTGSGKTYSMMGTPSDRGIMPRIGSYIWKHLTAFREAGNVAVVTMSFCELYNEKVRDLMNEAQAGGDFYSRGGQGLKVRLHPKTGVYVEGLIALEVSSDGDFERILQSGLASRATATTNMNNTSSRSHAVALVTVYQKDTSGSRTGKLCLVDLAGSERLDATGATGSTALEGQNINLSLTKLGMVLSRLADKADGKQVTHVPYRDSTLTFILMDNLGGNSKTSMLATISPASVNHDETLSTLRFASTAKRVKSVAVINEDPNDRLIRDLRAELVGLRARFAELQKESLGQFIPSADAKGDKDAEGDVAVAAQVARNVDETSSNNESREDDGSQSDGSDYSGILDDTPGHPSTSLFRLNLDLLQGASTPRVASPTSADFSVPARKSKVFVDWKAPQLINLHHNAEEAARQMSEGLNVEALDATHEIRIVFDSLQEQCILYSTTAEVFLNGVPLQREGALLRHNDRISTGPHALRFAFVASEMEAFQTEPTDVTHCEMLERYGRSVILEERAKQAIAIGRAYFRTVFSAELDVMRCVGNSTTPRSTIPLLAQLGDDLVTSNSMVYRAEVDLADNFPALQPAADQFTTFTYESVLAEREQYIEENRKRAAELRMQLLATFPTSPAPPTPTPPAQGGDAPAAPPVDGAAAAAEAPTELVDVERQINEQCFNAALEREVTWHRKVKSIKTFSINGPTDTTDREMWKRLFEAPPFSNDPTLCIEISAFASTMKATESSLVTRYIAASRRFLFLFDSDGSTPCTSSCYILGATIEKERIEEDGSYALLILPACPGHSNDLSLRPADCAVRIAFPSHAEQRTWHTFLTSNAVPSMPYSMRKRQMQEVLLKAGLVQFRETASTDEPIRGGPRRGAPRGPPAKRCASCDKPFQFIFRSRKRCATCEKDYCGNCLNDQGVCKNCREVRYTRGQEDFVEVQVIHHVQQMIVYQQVPHHERLSQRFEVKLSHGENDEFDDAVLCLDHYRHRIHTFLADEITSVVRRGAESCKLSFTHLDGTVWNVVFANSVDREHCYESICVMIGHRVFFPGVIGAKAAEVNDFLIVGTADRSCLVQATNQTLTHARVWAGVEDGKTIPFHLPYDIFLIVGQQDTWSRHTVQTYRLRFLAGIEVDKATMLYIVCTEKAALWVMNVERCSFFREGFDGAAVLLRMLDSTLLVVTAQPSATSKRRMPFSLSGAISASSESGDLDLILAVNHVFLIGCPRVTEIKSVCEGLQLFSETTQVQMFARHCAELLVPLTNIHFSKCSDASKDRPQITLNAVVRGTKRFANVQLHCTHSFDRISPTSIVLASSLPEYTQTAHVLIVIPEMGCCKYPVAGIHEESITLDVFRGFERVTTIMAEMSLEMVDIIDIDMEAL